jgi:NAD+ synthase (glutamine-hydrolysing)
MFNRLLQKRGRFHCFQQGVSTFVLIPFLISCILPPQVVRAQSVVLPPVPVHQVFTPTIVRGLSIYPNNPFQFDFIIDTGDESLKEEAFQKEAKKLISYFLASLTTPEEKMWVNLSPREKDRIIPDGFDRTQMGVDMLAQDYLLKKMTASLLYPENETGKKFWDTLKKKLAEHGQKEMPVNAFNKVWIVPDKATVYEHNNSVFVIQRHLKVMLEEDYLSQKAAGYEEKNISQQSATDLLRDIIIPEIEREVNEGKTFANLRQIYNAMILATWYKKNLRESVLGKAYVDQNKVGGINNQDARSKEDIYNQYLGIFEEGLKGYIRDEYDPDTQEITSKKYLTGGAVAVDESILDTQKGEIAGQTEALRDAALYPVGEDRSVTWRAVGNTNDKQDEAQLASAISWDSTGNTRIVNINDHIRFEIGRFPDGEIRLRNLNPEETKDSDITLTHFVHSEADIVQAIMIMDNLRHYGAKAIHLVLPGWKTLLNGDEYLLSVLSSFADTISVQQAERDGKGFLVKYKDPIALQNITNPPTIVKKTLPIKIDRIYYLDARFKDGANHIASRLSNGVKAEEMTVDHDDNGSYQVAFKNEEDPRGKNIFLYHTTRTSRDIVNLLLALAALRERGVESITLFNTYQGYARQDKITTDNEHLGEHIAAGSLLKIVDHFVDQNFAVNVHYGDKDGIVQLPGSDNLNVYNLNGSVPLAEFMAQTIIEQALNVKIAGLDLPLSKTIPLGAKVKELFEKNPIVVVSPDFGGQGYALNAARELERLLSVAFGVDIKVYAGFLPKWRNKVTGETLRPGNPRLLMITDDTLQMDLSQRSFEEVSAIVDGLDELELENGAAVMDAWAFILDDITATGGTLLSANSVLHEEIGISEKRIYNGVVHGAFSNGLEPFKPSLSMEKGKLAPAKLFAMNTLILPEETPFFQRVPIDSVALYAIERIIGKDLDKKKKSGKPKRIAIIGGSFNPFTGGHKRVGEQLLDIPELGLDEVIYVPANVSPLRQGEPDLETAQKRYDWVQRSIKGNSKMSVSDFDITREGPSYTADLVKYFKDLYPPGSKIYFVVGEDNVEKLPNWSRLNEITDTIESFIVYSRPGYKVPQTDLKIINVSRPTIDVSATETRIRAATGRSVRGFVADEIAEEVEASPTYTPDHVFSDFYKGRRIKTLKGKDVPYDKPFAVSFDVHGNLLESTWKKEYALAYHLLTGRDEKEGLLWVEEHIMKDIIETTRDVAHQDIVKRMKNSAIEITNQALTDADVEGAIQTARTEYKKSEYAKARPGSVEAVKTAFDLGFPIQFMSGSTSDVIKAQLTAAGFGAFISDDNLIGIDKQRALEDKDSTYNRREQAIIRFATKHPAHRIIQFDDWRTSMDVVKKLDGLTVSTPQGEGDEFNRNYNRLVHEEGADFVISKQSDWMKIVSLLRILNKKHLEAQKKTVKKNIRVAMAQLNPTVGDLVGNFKMVVDNIEKAKAQGVDNLIFPELVMTGYPAKDLLKRKSFVMQNKRLVKALVEHTKGISITVGFVDIDQKGKIYNAVAVISDGQIKGIYRKNALPNYGMFNEKRFFKPGKGAQLVDFEGNPLKEKVFDVDGVEECMFVCEDGWVNQEEDADLPSLDETDVLPEPDDSDQPEVYLEQAGLGARILFNSSASPFREGVSEKRLATFRKRAQQTGAWIVYTNLWGGQDEHGFDGGSFIMNPKGEIVAQAKRFGEDFVVADLEVETFEKNGTDSSSTIPLFHSENVKVPLSATPIPQKFTRLEEIEETLVMGMRDYFRKNGLKKAILGMSGGLDSAYAAYLAVKALGKENVIAVSMPTKFNSDDSKSYARLQAEKLGIEFMEVPIGSLHQAFRDVLGTIYINTPEGPSILNADKLVDENIQPKIRMAILYAISNAVPGSLVLSTGNKSELSVGFFTAYGDGAGGWSSIGDVYKTDVYKLARHANEKAGEETVLNDIIDAVPTAGLNDGGVDEDRLPPYPVLDAALIELIDREASIVGLIERGQDGKLLTSTDWMIRVAQWKRAQIAKGINIGPKSFAANRNMPIVNRYDEVATQAFLDALNVHDAAMLSDAEKTALTPVFSSADEFFSQIDAWQKTHPDSNILTLVRHGESGSNVFGLVQTYTSFSPLTLLGEHQAEDLARFFKEKNVGFDRYISSDLERANQTILPTAKDFGRNLEIYKRFREVLLHPVAGGVELQRLKDHFPDLFKKFLTDPLKYDIPGQYSGQKFKRYAREKFAEIAAGDQRRTIIASHGLTIVLSVMELLGIDYHKYYPVYDALGSTTNLSLTVFAYDKKTEKWQLLVKPDNTYLKSELRGRTTDENEKKREYNRFLEIARNRQAAQVEGVTSLLSDYFPTEVTFFQPDPEQLRDMLQPHQDWIKSLMDRDDEAMLAQNVDALNKELPPGYPLRSKDNTPNYTSIKVKENARSRENEEGWADPDLDDPTLSSADQNRYEEDIRSFIQTFAPQTKFVNGRPRNKQEMFLNGRGDLGGYGPNLAEDAVILRLNQEGKIEVLAGVRSDYPDGLALAGQFAKRDEVRSDKIGVTASKAAKREFGANINFQRDGVVVYEGPAGDWRDTNDAWVATRGVAVLLTYEESQRLNIEAKKGMTPESVRWVSVAEKNKFYARHQFIIERALSKVALNQLKTSAQKKVGIFDELTMTIDDLDEAFDAFRSGKDKYQDVHDFLIPQTPHGGNYYVAAGLEEALADIRRRRFTPDHIDQLRKLGRYNEKFLQYLTTFIFEGDVSGLREGTVVTSDVPLLRVKASPVEIKLLQGLIKNRLGFNTNIATKTSRIVQAANGLFISPEARARLIKDEGYDPVYERMVIDYGQRRAQGKAATAASRSAVIGGAVATSNVKAAKQHYLEPSGTMAHAFIMMFPPEMEIEAFRIYAEAYPDTSVFLIDTYNTIEGAKKAIKVALEMRAKGHELLGVRLDSGDLVSLSKEVRRLFNEAGLNNVKIFASDDLNEDRITELLSQGARIDGFGVGTNLITGGKQASLEIKVVKSDEKRFWRVHQNKGQIQKFITTAKNRVAYAGYSEDIEEMLMPFWEKGDRVNDPEKPWQGHLRGQADMKRLKPEQRKLEGAAAIPVEERDNPLSINPEEDGVLDIDATGAFFTGGGLPVGQSEEIVKPGRKILDLFPKKQRFAAIDKHPWGHISLATSYIDLPPMTTVLTPEVIADWTQEHNPIAEHALFNLSDLHVYLEGGFKRANFKDFIDDVDGLFKDLQASGYINQYGVKTQKFKDASLEDFQVSEKFAKQKNTIYKTLSNHRGVGFQVLWTEHAREDSGEDELYRGFLTKEFEYIVTKGMDGDDDSYSAFQSNAGVSTELDGEIKRRGVKRLFVWGLAEDYCVGFSACNAVDLGYEVYVIIDATKPVGIPEGSIENMKKEFEKRGIKVITSQELIDANQNLGVRSASRHEKPIAHPNIYEEDDNSAFEEDFYHLTMGQAMFNRGFHRHKATFDYFYRSTPFEEPYVIVSGVKLFLDDLVNFTFTDDHIAYLKSLKRFSPEYLEFLAGYKFRGNIYGLREGSVAYPRESIATVEGTMFDIIVETLLLKDMNFATLEASWANHIVESAEEPQQLIDDGLPTAQGRSHKYASWSAFIGGLNRTTNLDAHLTYGIPLATRNDEGKRLRENILTGGEKAAHGGVFKLSLFDGEFRAKVSGANPAKGSLPGDKRSYEIMDQEGQVVGVVNGLKDDNLKLEEGLTVQMRQIPWVVDGKIVYIVEDAFNIRGYVRDQVKKFAGIEEAVVSDRLAAAQKDLIERAQSAQLNEERVTQLNRKSPTGYPTRNLDEPPVFTAGHVMEHSISLEKGETKLTAESWAHPWIEEPGISADERARRVAFVQADIKRWAPNTQFGEDGLPVLKFKTGMKGRGFNGRYGPNPTEDFLVFRISEDGSDIEVLTGLRKDGGGRALPGGHITHGDENDTGKTAQRELKEELDIDLPLDHAEKIVEFDGEDLWGITDNAWKQQRAVAVLLTYEQSLKYEPKAGDDFEENSQEWSSATAENGFRSIAGKWVAGMKRAEFFSNHTKLIVAGLEAIKDGKLRVADQALVADGVTEKRGGIDFNSSQMDLNIKRDGKGVSVPVYNEPVNFHIDGLTPFIINIIPANVPLLLGVTQKNDKDSDSAYSKDSLFPEQISFASRL